MAQAVPLLITAAVAAGTTVAASALAPKPKPIAPPPIPTRNMAAEAARSEDALRKRRGAGANELTGGGAEASTTGGKLLLGQ